MKLYQKIPLIFFGLSLTIVILEIGLRIAGFTILSIQEYRNLQSIKQKGEFRIMCLGESTTRSQYPSYLENFLNQRNIGIKFSVIDKGTDGINTDAILSELQANIDKYKPDMVVTMMGINDGASHMPYETVSASRITITLHSFKVYKLTRFLWLRIITKLKEKGFYAQDIDKQKDNPREAYKKQGFFHKEQAFKKTLEINSGGDSAYTQLGCSYMAQGKFVEAEQALQKAIELNPRNDSPYIHLGSSYAAQGKFVEAEQACEKAIELNPNSDFAYAQLGCSYIAQGKFVEAEQACEKAIELNPNSDSAYTQLGCSYMAQGKFVEAEQACEKAIELNPNSDSAYTQLGCSYMAQGKFVEAEQALQKAIELNHNNELAFRELATVYSAIGNSKLSDIYAERAGKLRGEYYKLATVNNYRMLKQILDNKKIKLICVQYPMRNIVLLKKIFKEDMENNIIFVDNEKIFKDAIKKASSGEYFRDMFGKNFGHCTPKGNRLLAENIANAIAKKYFNK